MCQQQRLQLNNRATNAGPFSDNERKQRKKIQRIQRKQSSIETNMRTAITERVGYFGSIANWSERLLRTVDRTYLTPNRIFPNVSIEALIRVCASDLRPPENVDMYVARSKCRRMCVPGESATESTMTLSTPIHIHKQSNVRYACAHSTGHASTQSQECVHGMNNRVDKWLAFGLRPILTLVSITRHTHNNDGGVLVLGATDRLYWSSSRRDLK